jgi:hypothetical protein
VATAAWGDDLGVVEPDHDNTQRAQGISPPPLQKMLFFTMFC